MTLYQRLQMEASRGRERLIVLAGKGAEMSDEERQEMSSLTDRQVQIEGEQRAAMIAEQEQAETAPDGETVEKQNLETRAQLGNYVTAALKGVQVDGAERELQQAEGLSPEAVPWAAIAPEDAPVEHRAVTVPPALDSYTAAAGSSFTAGSGPQAQETVLSRVFSGGAAAHLRIGMPMVPVGVRAYPVLTGGADPATKARGADADEPAATFSSITLDPRRLTVAYRFRAEDAAVFSGLESALRRDMSDALTSALDNVILTGSGSDPVPGGLLGGGLTAPSADSAVVDFAKAVARLSDDHVDGLYQDGPMGIRTIIGPPTYKKLASLLVSGDAVSVYRYIQQTTGNSLRVHAGVPAMDSTSKNQGLVTCKGTQRAAVAPVWSGVSIIRDPYTSAKKAEVVLTIVMLYSFGIIRSAQFARGTLKLQA